MVQPGGAASHTPCRYRNLAQSTPNCLARQNSAQTPAGYGHRTRRWFSRSAGQANQHGKPGYRRLGQTGQYCCPIIYSRTFNFYGASPESANSFWEFPHLSRRLPILAANVVSTTQPLAAQAGLRMLLAGGNAVDAALAAAITLTVVEPVMNGIGGDAFALVWDQGKLHGLNASGRAPAAWTPERFAGRDA